MFFVCVGVMYESHASTSQEDHFPQGSRSMAEAQWAMQNCPDLSTFERACDEEHARHKLMRQVHLAYNEIVEMHGQRSGPLRQGLWAMALRSLEQQSGVQDEGALWEHVWPKMLSLCQLFDYPVAPEALLSRVADAKERVHQKEQYAFLRGFMARDLNLDTRPWMPDMRENAILKEMDAQFLESSFSYSEESLPKEPKRQPFALTGTSQPPLEMYRMKGSAHDALMVFAIKTQRSCEDLKNAFHAFRQEQLAIIDRVRQEDDLSSFTQRYPFFFDFDLLDTDGVKFWDGNEEVTIPTTKIPPQATIALLGDKNFQGLSYDPRFRLYNGFVLSDQLVVKAEPITEEDRAGILDVTCVDGHLQSAPGVGVPDGAYTWALDPMGRTRLTSLDAIHHSGLFQKDDVGLPLACAGEIVVRKNLIENMNNETGHYLCTVLQLARAVQHYEALGVLSPMCQISVRYFGQPPVQKGLYEMLTIAQAVNF
ncbi:MAG: hypothetical protein C0514_07830 [Candidatus Puniceispirillum sp.]|nr:hypothetical protein [Candidatus Puniceispirillum sp.]